MLLVKCKCGCVYTLNETIAGIDKWINCPSCSCKVHINTDNSIFSVMEVLQKNSDVQRLPDNAKITVSFGT